MPGRGRGRRTPYSLRDEMHVIPIFKLLSSCFDQGHWGKERKRCQQRQERTYRLKYAFRMVGLVWGSVQLCSHIPKFCYFAQQPVLRISLLCSFSSIDLVRA